MSILTNCLDERFINFTVFFNEMHALAAVMSYLVQIVLMLMVVCQEKAFIMRGKRITRRVVKRLPKKRISKKFLAKMMLDNVFVVYYTPFLTAVNFLPNCERYEKSFQVKFVGYEPLYSFYLTHFSIPRTDPGRASLRTFHTTLIDIRSTQKPSQTIPHPH